MRSWTETENAAVVARTSAPFVGLGREAQPSESGQAGKEPMWGSAGVRPNIGRGSDREDEFEQIIDVGALQLEVEKMRLYRGLAEESSSCKFMVPIRAAFRNRPISISSRTRADHVSSKVKSRSG